MPASNHQAHADLTIWDIMGDGGFRVLLKETYFRGSQSILAVCTVTRPLSLARLEGWREAATKVVGEIPTYVLTNTDRASFGEVDLKAVADEYDAPYAFTSAQDGENVQEGFQGLAEAIVE